MSFSYLCLFLLTDPSVLLYPEHYREHNCIAIIILNTAKDMNILGCWRFLCKSHLCCRWRIWIATSWSQSLSQWWEALLVGDVAQGIRVLEKNKTSISCNSADGGDRGRDKLQPYSLQYCSNEPRLFSTQQQIVQRAGWATKWKQYLISNSWWTVFQRFFQCCTAYQSLNWNSENK